jgi:hypothetical protein
MSIRIFLLPGYGEDHRAFRQLSGHLQDFELVPVDYRPVLANIPITAMNSKRMAQQLIRQYKITQFDKLVGHSMGGFFSFQIREILGNDICMIGSFCDPGKIIHLTPIRQLTPLMAATGISKTPMARNYLHKKVVGKPHEEVMMEVVNNFRSFRNIDLAKLSLVTLENKLSTNLPNPLRIHADDDRVVRTPDEAYIKVDGGHFSLNLHPREVVDAMETFLNN